MKKTLLVLVVALLTSMVAFAQVTDTIVSTAPSNRNVVIEEYTGINCGYCPDGHRIANEIMAAHPDRVCVINIHQGGYANNTYTTQFGNALANQTGLTGYPAGTVNRHVFPNYVDQGESTHTVTDLYRSYWPYAANDIMSMSSPVNIAAEGTLDWSTRTVNIRVQLYYTGSQTVNSNMLNVAILQDYVKGSQSGMSSNPDQVVGTQYNHMHMLRHLITGQWGETIETITPGTLVEKNYTYVIPAKLGSPNSINAVLENLTFVAFVTEGHQEILTGVHIPITYENVEGYNAQIFKVYDSRNKECNSNADAYFTFKNVSCEPATSIDYNYTVRGTTYNGTWTGNVGVMETGQVDLPTFEINLNQNNGVTAKITAINGHEISSAASPSLSLKKYVYSCGGAMHFTIATDAYGSETSFKFFDPNDNVVLSGDNFPNLQTATVTVNEFDFLPSTTGCYRLEVYDSYGDGINSGAGAGYFKLVDENGAQIFRDNGKFGLLAIYMLDVTYPAGIEDVTMGNTVVYPNPATEVININTTDNVQRVEIFNMQGQLVKAEIGDVNSISVKSLANGLYTLKLTTDNGVSMHKIIKK